MFSERE